MSQNMIPLDGEGQKKRVVSHFICSRKFLDQIMLTSPSVLLLRLGHRGFPLWSRTPVSYGCLSGRGLWRDYLPTGWNQLVYECVIPWSWTMVCTRKWRYSWVHLRMHGRSLDPNFTSRSVLNLQQNAKWHSFTLTNTSSSSVASPPAIWIRT